MSGKISKINVKKYIYLAGRVGLCFEWVAGLKSSLTFYIKFVSNNHCLQKLQF